MAEMKKQPEVDIQALLDSVLEEEPEKVTFRGREYKIGWLHLGTMRKFSHITLKEKDMGKQAAKLAACVLLNTRWKLFFLYWLWWRWIYYIIDPSPDIILGIIDAGKKKLPHLIYMLITMYSTAMTDTIATMTEKERKQSQAERVGEEPTASEKSSPSS